MERPTQDELPREAKGFLGMAELRMTPGKGIGVFATQFIPANQQLYEYEGKSYNKEEAIALLDSMSTHEEREYWAGAYLWPQWKIGLLLKRWWSP
jgi:hypothetical protein